MKIKKTEDRIELIGFNKGLRILSIPLGIFLFLVGLVTKIPILIAVFTLLFIVSTFTDFIGYSGTKCIFDKRKKQIEFIRSFCFKDIYPLSDIQLVYYKGLNIDDSGTGTSHIAGYDITVKINNEFINATNCFSLKEAAARELYLEIKKWLNDV